MLTPVEYYRVEDVRRCMREYCGLTEGEHRGAAYVVGFGADGSAQPMWQTAPRVPASDVEQLWDAGCDIARSLWDRSQLIFFLDLDYQNVDAPDEPFLRPAEAYFKLEPTYQAVRDVLDTFGIDEEPVMTGRGYHFVGAVPLEHALVDRLGALVPETPSWWRTRRARLVRGVDAEMSARQARAADGLGLLIEYVAHRVLRLAAPRSALPVVVNGTVVGAGLVGRECVSIDFSHVGDPLDERFMRSAFSTYQWHIRRPDIVGPRASGGVPPLVALPRSERPFTWMLERGRHCDAAAAAAPSTPAFLPLLTPGISRLLDAYVESDLAAFHREYLAATRWAPATAHPLPRDITPCVRAPFEQPNDLLLKPEFLQQIVRSLMARDWHPADVAARVRAAYEADHDWGDRWTRLDARTRAEFDVRVFAGLIREGLDGLVDCNCVSAQEKGLCPRVMCGRDLRADQERLLRRYPQ